MSKAIDKNKKSHKNLMQNDRQRVGRLYAYFILKDVKYGLPATKNCFHQSKDWCNDPQVSQFKGSSLMVTSIKFLLIISVHYNHENKGINNH